MNPFPVSLETFPDLANMPVGDFEPKPTSVEGYQMEAAKELWASEDGTVRAGIWECTEGRFQTHREDSSEICHIISGRAEMRNLGGESRDVGPGDLLVLPVGWRGEWRILERLRKFYVVQNERR